MATVTGRYAQLRDDLVAAYEAAAEAARASGDGGTCNMDTLMITFPRGRAAAVEAAVKAAGGSYASSWSFHYGAGAFSIDVPHGGQAQSRTAAVEAARKSLKDRGWEAWVRYVID